MLTVVNKEVDEVLTSIAHQHTQQKEYLQIYLMALGGLFAISGFFSSNGSIGVKESVIGAVCTITVFLLGWFLLSTLSHRIAMLIMLYKHLAFLRDLRITAVKHEAFEKGYVLPYSKDQIKMPGLLHYLPYMFFAFNFLVLCGGLAFYFQPHMKYHQVVATVSAFAVFFGSFYPLVCVTFKRHVVCAEKANSIVGMRKIDDYWHRQIKERQWLSRIAKVILGTLAIVGSIAIAIFSLFVDRADTTYFVFLVWMGTITYALVRFFLEKFRISVQVSSMPHS